MLPVVHISFLALCLVNVGDAGGPTCPQLSDPENGEVRYLSRSRGYSTFATYHCDEDYVRSGPSWQQCGRNGRWTRQPPTCEPDIPCGWPTVAQPGQVIVGQPSTGSLPWVAQIYFARDVFPKSNQPHVRCGGSLIAPDWVLTAAHCFFFKLSKTENVANFQSWLHDYWKGALEIRLGKYYQQAPEEEADQYSMTAKIKQIILHPDYGRGENNDIALVQLVDKVEYSDYIRPICLPSSDFYRDHLPTTGPSMTMGWGYTSYRGQYANELQWAWVFLQKDSMCNINENIMCAGLKEGGVDSCLGDSGGPLIVKHPDSDSWYQIGVVQGGRKCALPDTYGYYTKAFNYYSWIENQTGSLSRPVANKGLILQRLPTSGDGSPPEPCGKPVLAQPGKKDEEEDRVVGGYPAAVGSAPWIAKYSVMRFVPGTRKGGRFFCAGSLISRRWVMTAAHCLEDMVPSQTMVVSLGKYKREGKEEHQRDYVVEDTITHPDYRLNARYDNDIALLRLTERVEYNNRTMPICIPTEDEYERNLSGGSAIVTGWGETLPQLPGARGDSLIPSVLIEGEIALQDDATCRMSPRVQGNVTDNMICAGQPRGGIDACQGDSGGPFIKKQGDSWYMIGVVSWGKGCAYPGEYGYYTKVANYHDWIRETMLSNKP